MAAGLRTIRIRLVGDASGLNKTAEQGQKQLQRWSRSFRRIGNAAAVGGAGAAGALGGVAAAAAGAVGAVGALGVAVAARSKEARKAFGQLGDQIKSGITGAVEPLVPVLVQFAEQAGKTFERILPMIERMMEQVAPLVRLLGDQLLKAVETVAPAFMRLFQAGLPIARMLINALTPAAEALAAVLSGMATALAAAGEWLMRHQRLALALAGVVAGLVVTMHAVSAALRVWAAVTRAWTVATKVATVAQRALNLVMRANPIGIVITLITALVAGIVLAYRRSETFRRIVNAAFRAVKAAALAVVDWFTGTFVPFFTQTIPNAFRTVRDFLVRTWRTIKDGAVRAFTAMMRFVRSIPGKIKNAFSNAIELLVGIGRDVINGLTNGIVRAMKGIKNWLKEHVWDPIVNAVKSLFGIESPSTVFADFGRQMILGLIRGMIQTSPARLVRKALGGVTGALSGLLDTLFPGGGGNPSANMQLGRAMAAAMGWTGGQWDALRALWMGESGWNHRARNPMSGAYGIPQSLPASKMAAAGADWRTNPATQIKWGLNYIANRYGTPAAAYQAWLSRSPHWYDTGGVATGAGLIPKATSEPERVLSPQQTAAFERLVDTLAGGGVATRPLVGTLAVQTPVGATTRQLLDETMHQLRVVRRKGQP